MSINQIVNQIIEARVRRQIVGDYLESQGFGYMNYGKSYIFGSENCQVIDVSLKVSNTLIVLTVQLERDYSMHKSIVITGLKPSDAIQLMEKHVAEKVNRLLDINDVMNNVIDDGEASI
jgi:hypothetical protein